MITLDVSGALKKLTKLEKNAGKVNWNEIGRMALRSIDKNFQAGGRYSQPGSQVGGSTKWQPRKDKSNHPLLIKSGTLKNGMRMELGANGITIRTTAFARDYAAAQNFGFADNNLPARPFMTIPPHEIHEMEEELKRQLLKGL